MAYTSDKQFQTFDLDEGIQLCIGDSRKLSLRCNEKAKLFVTSPPYWNLKDYGPEGQIGQTAYDEYIDELVGVFLECYDAAADNAVLVVNINSRRHKKQFYPIAFDLVAKMRGWKFWDHVIWYIPNALPQPNHYMERILDNKHESCLVFTKDGSSDFEFHKPRVPQKYVNADPRNHKRNSRGRCIGNVLRIPAYRPPNIKKLGYHVAAYPEELVAFFIECYTSKGDLVVDPFVGSGTTLKVCRAMNRRGLGFELNSDFLDLIKRRVDEYWETPDWKKIDILHSATAVTGSASPRKVQFQKKDTRKTLFATPD